MTTHNFGIICLSETFLDSRVSQHDENIMINGYLLKVDHPSNSKSGGVCLHFIKHLPLIGRNYFSVLQECLVTEIIVDNEICFFTCLYRSPNQNHEELESFSSNLDLLISNINNNHPTCSILIGDFNVRSSKWCNSDQINRASRELDNITTSAGYSQLIYEPTHFINKTSSCVDLIFSSDFNITRNCGIDNS